MCCLKSHVGSYAFMNTIITAFSFHVNTVSLSMKFMLCCLTNCCEMCHYLFNNIVYRVFVKSRKIVPAHAHFGRMLFLSLASCRFVMAADTATVPCNQLLPVCPVSCHCKTEWKISSKVFPYKVFIWIKILTILARENQLQFYVDSFRRNETNTAKCRRINYKRNSVVPTNVKY
jgi:hypothetical protein